MSEELLTQTRQDISEARQAFRMRVIETLKAATQHADALALAIGEVSPDDAYDAWVKFLLEDIGRREVERLRSV